MGDYLWLGELEKTSSKADTFEPFKNRLGIFDRKNLGGAIVFQKYYKLEKLQVHLRFT